MGKITVLTSDGDITVEWDPKDRESTAKAEAEFDRLKADGYVFYERGKTVSKFQKSLGVLVAAPGGRSGADKRSGTRERAMAGGPTNQTSRAT